MEPNIPTQEVVPTKNRRVLLDKIMFGILLGVAFLSPVFFVPASFIPVQFGTSLLFAFGVIVSVLIYTVGALVYGSVELPKSSKYVLWFLFSAPIIYMLAGVANGFSRLSFFGYTFDINTVGFILISFAYMFLVSLLFRDVSRIFYSYFAFVVSSILVAVFILIRLIFGTEVLSFDLFQSITATTIGTWNSVGIFFGIGLILSLFTYEMINTSRFMKILLSLSIILSLFFLTLVNFVAVWAVVALSVFLFIVYRIFSRTDYSKENDSFKKKISRIPVYSAIIFLASLAMVIWGGVLSSYLSNTFEVSNVEIRPTLSVTLEIARNTLSNHPLFGSGPNTFINEWLTWKPDSIISTTLWNVDFNSGIGLIPTFLVTTGLLGTLSWLAFLGFYLYVGIKSIFVRMENAFEKYLVASSFFVSLYLWMMTFVYVPSAVVFILTFFFTGLFFASVYLSGIIKVENVSFGGSPKRGFLSSLLLVAIVVSGLSLANGLFMSSKSLLYFQKSSHSLNNDGDILASEAHMLKAIETVPLDIYYRALSEIEIIKLNAVVNQDVNQVPAETIQEQFRVVLADAIRAGRFAKDSNPDNYLNWISLGRVYDAVSLPELKVEGAYESAVNAYEEAMERNPKNPSILLLFSRLAVNVRDWDTAREYAYRAINLKNNYLDAYFLLSQIEASDNNLKAAIESANTATIIDPTNPALFFQLGLLKYNSKDYTGAIVALEEAIKLAPEYANAKYFLGLSYEAVGNHEGAIAQFEDLSKTNPDNADVSAILTDLKAGKKIIVNTSGDNSLPVEENVR